MRCRKIGFVVLLAALLTRAVGARADAPGPVADPAAPAHDDEAKSATAAVDEAKSATAAVALELLLPGLGSLYADDPAGAGVTWACLAGGFAALWIGVSQLHLHGPDGPEPPAMPARSSPLAMPLVIGGAAVALIGRLHGLQGAADAAARYNAARPRPFAIAPFVTSGAGGITLGGRF